jgi:hypothetical protein
MKEIKTARYKKLAEETDFSLPPVGREYDKTVGEQLRKSDSEDSFKEIQVQLMAKEMYPTILFFLERGIVNSIEEAKAKAIFEKNNEYMEDGEEIDIDLNKAADLAEKEVIKKFPKYKSKLSQEMPMEEVIDQSNAEYEMDKLPPERPTFNPY